MATRDVEQLLTLAARYGSAKALALSTVSLYAARQGQLMARLQAGCGITVARRDRILQWFSDHWPEEVSWPEDILRPVPGRLAGERVRREPFMIPPVLEESD